jgi:hypothetical protein
METRYQMQPTLPAGQVADWLDIGKAIAYAEIAFPGNAGHISKGEQVLRELLDKGIVWWRADEVDVDANGNFVEMRGVQVDMVPFRKWLKVS